MSQSDEHETHLQDSQKTPDKTLEVAQPQIENTNSFDNTSTVPDESTTGTHCFTLATNSNIPNIPVTQTTENDTMLFQKDEHSFKKDTHYTNFTPPQTLLQQVKRKYDPPIKSPEFPTHNCS